MAHETNNTYLSLRITPTLAADLKKVAALVPHRTPSGVARRLIAAGVERELAAAERRAADRTR